MMAEIGAGVGSLKAAIDIVKGLNAANTQAAINDAKITLQQHIIEAQTALSAAAQAQSAAEDEIRDLKRQIVGLKDWESEKSRYQLKRYIPGAFAFALKPEMANGEPPHSLCEPCYNKGQKSRLHAIRPDGRGTLHKCLSCNAEIILGEEVDDGPIPPAPAPKRSPINYPSGPQDWMRG